MNKPFSMPIEFALKWVKELESGKYSQGNSTLVFPKESNLEDTDNPDDFKFCCLGIAGICAGLTVDDMLTYDILDNFSNVEELPTAIQGSGSDSIAVRLLTALNDGLTLALYETLISFYPNIKLDYIPKKGESIIYNFEQIARVIKDNFKFIPTINTEKMLKKDLIELVENLQKTIDEKDIQLANITRENTGLAMRLDDLDDRFQYTKSELYNSREEGILKHGLIDQISTLAHNSFFYVKKSNIKEAIQNYYTILEATRNSRKYTPKK